MAKDDTIPFLSSIKPSLKEGKKDNLPNIPGIRKTGFFSDITGNREMKTPDDRAAWVQGYYDMINQEIYFGEIGGQSGLAGW